MEEKFLMHAASFCFTQRSQRAQREGNVVPLCRCVKPILARAASFGFTLRSQRAQREGNVVPLCGCVKLLCARRRFVSHNDHNAHNAKGK